MRPVAGLDIEQAPERLASLVAGAAAGDEEAWEALVSLYARRIYAMAKSRLRDPETAEEITQSVFATLAEQFRRGTRGYEERGRFEAWLFRIAMNRVRDEGRRRARAAVSLPMHDGGARTDGAAPDEREIRLESLRAALDRLDGPDREVIGLRHHGGLSFAQISDLLGEPLGTVLARHHRALKKLRRELESHDAPGRVDAAAASDGEGHA